MTIKHLFPLAKPKLDLNFAAERSLDPRITFTRSSTGTYIDAKGILQTAANDEPRFDHSGTGKSLGLLLEESRTNYCEYSQIDSTNWTQGGTSSLSASAVSAPDGGTCFDLTTDSGGPNSVRLQSSSSPTGTVALSVFARFPNTGFTALNIRMVGVSGGVNFYADFYPATESFSGLVNCTGSFESFANGWYKITIVSTGSSTAGSHEFRVGGGIGSSSFTAQTCQVWSAQLEAGSFATSLIPTAGSTVTRSADVCTITGSNFSSWYNNSEGTYVAKFRSQYPDGEGTTVIQNGSRIFAHVNVNRVQFDYGSNYVYSNDGSSGYPAASEFSNAALFYTDDGANFTVGGSFQGFPVVSTSGTGSVSNTDLEFAPFTGASGALQSSTAHLSRLAYYSHRLSDEQLQALTA